MASELESAFHGLLKIVVQEVVTDLQSRGLLVNPVNSEQDPVPDDRLLMRSNEVVKRLSISERHLHRMTVEGGLPCVRIGQSVRYRVETVKEWLRKAESTETPQPRQQASVKKKSIITKQPKKTRNSIQKKVVEQKTAKHLHSDKVTKRNKEKSPKKTNLEPEQERSNPFRLLLEEIDVDRDTLGPVTNGELMKIAEVDLPTFHGWMYLGQSMPEEAVEKLRKHFTHSTPPYKNWLNQQ